MNKIKLTSLSSGAGWACKINPKDLGEILKKLNKSSLISKNDIRGFATSDDCSVYPLDNGNYLLQSVDFFTPIVDDPYEFGRIAAANSFSDIYAMGGKPIFALNITCFPSDDLPLEILHKILKGGQDIANHAGVPILGGHSIKDKEPKYGLVVTGIVEKNKLVCNNTAKIGDNLILTKPIGTGIISTAIKKNIATKNDIHNITEIMTHSNSGASRAMNIIGVNACTDITGYGLLGHLKEMCESSKVKAKINFDKIPLIENAINFANDKIVPGGSKKNYDFVKPFVQFNSKINESKKILSSDAQTSGGLLISVSKSKSDKLIEQLKKYDCISHSIIGSIHNEEQSNLIEVI